MKFDATPETIRAVAEMFKLAAVLDDRIAQADRARIAAWSTQVQRHHLTEGDLLDGLQTFYDSPHDRAIGIGDLIHHARYARRARLDIEEDEERERRRVEQDTKAADEILAVTAEAIIGRTKDTPRLIAAREALQTCEGKLAAIEAIREFNAAKAEASGKRPKRVAA